MSEAKETKITKWESGNELVRLADELSRAIDELKDWPELQKPLRVMRKDLSKLFYANGLHVELGFGI